MALNDFLNFLAKYWLEWLFGLIALGISFGAKHYVKLQKESWTRKWEERKNEAKDEVINKLEKEIREEAGKSEASDKRFEVELEVVQNNLENLTIGILSMQGKQFRDECYTLLKDFHKITIEEYEQFEEDYKAYKNLGGNHRGDALHDRVVEKFNSQLTKKGDQDYLEGYQ